MKRTLSLVLTLMLLCCVASASAESPLQWNSRTLYTCNIYLSASTSGSISITFRAVGTGLCSQIGVASYEVERMDASGNWYDASGAMTGDYGYNVVSHSFNRSFSGTPGGTYRVKATFLCSQNGVIDTINYTSQTITVPTP